MTALTDKQSYAAMFYFVDLMHRMGWQELGGLLGSMLLIDGKPLDLAFINDWRKAIQFTSDANVEDTQLRTLTEDQAYAAMWHFLVQMYEAKHEKIDTLIENMTLIHGMPSDRHLLVVWEKAIEFALSGGKVDPLIVTKDGISYEVHRGPGTSGTA